MPQTIKLKRSATPGQVPTTAQLDLGEMAINTADGKIFVRKDDGTTDVVMELNATIAGTATKSSVGATAPTDPAPAEGDIWFDTANDKLMYYDGTVWAEVGSTLTDSTITGNTILGDAASDTLVVNATADFNAPVNIDGDLTTTANSTFGDAASDTHAFNGNVTLNNDLTVTGTTSLNGNISLGDGDDTVTVNGLPISDLAFSSGTKMLFQQSTAPTGWTKDTTHNDKTLRVVSGAAGNGGTNAFSTVFTNASTTSAVAVSGTTDETTLTAAAMAAHSHVQGYAVLAASGTPRYGTTGTGINSNQPEHEGDANWGGSATGPNTSTVGGGAGGGHSHTFSSTAHTHTLDIDVQYVDIIIATKD